MQTINLKQYYPFCTEDTFVEVSDEIVEAFLLDKRAEAEGFTTSAAIVTVRNAIIKLQKYYIKRGWMKPPKEKAICTKTAPPKRNRKKTSAKKS